MTRIPRLHRDLARTVFAFLWIALSARSGVCEGTATAGADRPRMTPARTDLKPFEYVEAQIPYYPPGGDRRGDGVWDRMQLPLDAEESMRHIVVPEGFRVELFASDPDIRKVVFMNWDESGRLWIGETVDYPNQIQPEGKGRDRIRILEDRDGDGRADRFSLFADRLSVPTSLAFHGGGVIVHQAPHTLFLRDTDGDDLADVRRVLFTGWSTDDTHAGPANLRYGLDNWIWGTQGYAGFEGRVGGRDHSFRMGFHRFRPDASQLEFVAATDNNTWGLGFSEEGLVFGSTANNNPSVHVGIPRRYYQSVSGWTPEVLGGIADTARFRPITDRIRQVDVHGGYTAAAGHSLYTARAYPRNYWNRIAFVNGPTGHLLGAFVLERRGAGLRSTNPFNLMASDDEWTAPVVAEVGPDGCVWVSDWYNYIVQHNPTPAGFRTGKGNAYEIDLRDKTRGRIYRIVHEGSPPVRRRSLADASAGELVATLAADNMLWRLHAQRLLVERGERDVVPGLIELVNRESVDEIGQDVGAVHALWTLHGLGALDGSDPGASLAAVAALLHPAAGVRLNAARVLPRTEASVDRILRARLLEDADAQVRLAALLALSEMPRSDRAAAAVYLATTRRENVEDRWLADALTIAAARHDEGFLAVVLEEAADRFRADALFRRALEPMIRTVAGGFGARRRELVVGLLAALDGADDDLARAFLTGLGEGWPEGVSPVLSEGDDELLRELRPRFAARGLGDFARLVHRWESLVAKAPPAGPAAPEPEGKNKARVIELGTLTGVMKYDQEKITVTAGERIRLVFKNSDFMMHNLVIVRPGKLELVGALADKMITDPEGLEKQYVPESPDVLLSTKLVPPTSSFELVFTAPREPGEYPYVCTFPGHWKIMRGTLLVMATP